MTRLLFALPIMLAFHGTALAHGNSEDGPGFRRTPGAAASAAAPRRTPGAPVGDRAEAKAKVKKAISKRMAAVAQKVARIRKARRPVAKAPKQAMTRVPELDPQGSTAALALLVGGLAVTMGRRRRQSP